MGKYDKLLTQVLRGASDANIPFDGLCGLMRHIGFDERVRGSHHIYSREGVEEIVNLQPLGSRAKAYQVKQVRGIILRYKLGGETDE
jgi:hypothetical protein